MKKYDYYQLPDGRWVCTVREAVRQPYRELVDPLGQHTKYRLISSGVGDTKQEAARDAQKEQTP